MSITKSSRGRARTALRPRTRDELERNDLARCLDACRACETSCATAMDDAAERLAALHVDRSVTLLRMCAMLCDATASSIARMRTPNVDSIADALLACSVACRAVRADRERYPMTEAMGDDCASRCARCATICDGLLGRSARIAAA
jgi:hypothetical protein